MASPVPVFASLPRPLLFAHRGASALAPENTFQAFDLAVRLGAHVLEMDAHLTSDGEVVVFHDATLERTTDGTGPLRSKMYTQLCGLDAGAKYRGPNGEALFAGRDVQIPRLYDVLRAFPRSGFNIEIKRHDPTLIAKVVDMVRGLPPEQVVLAAADDATMRALDEAQPHCGLGLSAGQARQVLRGALWRRVGRDFAGRALQIPMRYCGLPLCRPSMLRQICNAGIEVHIWTIDDPKVAAKLLQRGVHGIMTNDPGRLLGELPAFAPKESL